MAETVVRVTISVPKALKARMDQVAGAVNWSGVASEAFERRVLEMESNKDAGNDLEALAARFKAADDLVEQEDYQEGTQAGQRWVRSGNTRAVLRGMRRLDKLDEERDGVDFALAAVDDNTGGRVAIELAHMLAPDLGQDRGRVAEWRDVKEFWEGILGAGGAERIDSYQFALGFVHGAREVWDKVQESDAWRGNMNQLR